MVAGVMCIWCWWGFHALQQVTVTTYFHKNLPSAGNRYVCEWSGHIQMCFSVNVSLLHSHFQLLCWWEPAQWAGTPSYASDRCSRCMETRAWNLWWTDRDKKINLLITQQSVCDICDLAIIPSSSYYNLPALHLLQSALQRWHYITNPVLNSCHTFVAVETAQTDSWWF